MAINGLPSVGERVLLLKPHPWAGYVGVVIATEEWLGRPAVAVQLESGHKAGLTQPEQWDYALRPKKKAT